MLELYHGTTSVCAQKVRLILAEKGLEWESHLLEIKRGYRQLTDLANSEDGAFPTRAIAVRESWLKETRNHVVTETLR